MLKLFCVFNDLMQMLSLQSLAIGILGYPVCSVVIVGVAMNTNDAVVMEEQHAKSNIKEHHSRVCKLLWRYTSGKLSGYYRADERSVKC